MAHLSGDPALLKAFHEDDDIHRVTAAEIFDVPIKDVTADQRRYIKAVNFGLIYGMSAFGLAQQLGIERSAACSSNGISHAIRVPSTAAHARTAREQAMWKRSRPAAVPGHPRREQAAASGPERAAINAPMQGTAADLVKLAMIAVGLPDREQLATG